MDEVLAIAEELTQSQEPVPISAVVVQDQPVLVAVDAVQVQPAEAGESPVGDVVVGVEAAGAENVGHSHCEQTAMLQHDRYQESATSSTQLIARVADAVLPPIPETQVLDTSTMEEKALDAIASVGEIVNQAANAKTWSGAGMVVRRGLHAAFGAEDNSLHAGTP